MGLRPIEAVAGDLGIGRGHLLVHGRDKAKVALDAIGPPRGKLVAVGAITPTRAGEGKTTMSVGLAMGLTKLGVRAVPCLREPSIGPVFGLKGGGTGGGRATIEPQVPINLHFTGDLHAVGAAHNLLGALVDNDLHFGAPSGLDPRRVRWPRVLDVNDRALRQIVVGLGGDGVPRQSRFDITAASEVMAILCLARDLEDLRTRLGRIVVGESTDRRLVTADDVGATDAMTALLVDALQPNLAQTAEGGPAIVHGGPFANIAHGCSSVLGTRLGLTHADVVITEGGFGFDLGGEKLLDIKCRSAGLWPHLTVIVATLRALKVHGGAAASRATDPDEAALRAGLANLDAHLDAAARFGLPAVVAINRFDGDIDEELSIVKAHCASRGVEAASCDAFARGGAGAMTLAEVVRDALDGAERPEPRYAYPLGASYVEKIEALATGIYGADGVDVEPAARRALEPSRRPARVACPCAWRRRRARCRTIRSGSADRPASG